MTTDEYGEQVAPMRVGLIALQIVAMGIAVLFTVLLALLASTIAPTATITIAAGLALFALVGFVRMWAFG